MHVWVTLTQYVIIHKDFIIAVLFSINISNAMPTKQTHTQSYFPPDARRRKLDRTFMQHFSIKTFVWFENIMKPNFLSDKLLGNIREILIKNMHFMR